MSIKLPLTGSFDCMIFAMITGGACAVQWHEYGTQLHMGLAKRSTTIVPKLYKTLVNNVVPSQVKGGQSNIQVSCVCLNQTSANELYRCLKLLLLDVNNWHRYLPGISGHFFLTDRAGRAAQHQAIVGDHLKIKIPGPGLHLGGGFDWTTVQVREEITYGSTDLFHVRVSPSPNPKSDEPEVAHFFTAEASTTFIVLKEGRTVRMLIKSRNEVPNISVPGTRDQLRNRIVGLFAGLFFSRYQWAKLARTLLRRGIDTAGRSDKSFLFN